MAVEPDQAQGNVVRPLERLATSLAVALIGGVIIWDGARQTGESAYFPIAVGGAMVALSAITIAKLDRATRFSDEAPLAKGFAGLVMLGLFIWLAGHVGFLTSSLLLIPAMALLGGDRNVLRMTIGTIAFVGLAYLVFNLALSQPLPAELIFGD
ncbi:tripartite tricarboxylate transporter TctB family protein [Hoeflea olei]|uniref:DUF1468 domain-containing protein n=1 Tax=Hoeflea olei TaxID=1480615 RepID=A0A1C1Z1F4_9HYPH|nr:tripartite tricarboxylate transporter TctB family protein [Hoeflea olei]OCW59578.1 hypothetical protein AWJ14_11270 [Hoeflea olei]